MTTVSLGAVCEVTAGQAAPQESSAFGPQGKPFIRASSLDALVSGGSEYDCERIPDGVAARLRLRLFPKDTVLFAKSGMSATLGRVYRLRVPAYVVSHLAAVVPGESVCARYLQRWFEKNPPTRLIPNEAYPSIRTSAIAALCLDLPPKSEQERIADILDKADAIRRKRREAIDLTEELQRSVFLRMVGPGAHDYAQWPVRTVEGLAVQKPNSMRTGPFGSDLLHSEFVDEGIAVLGIDNAVQNRFAWDERRFITQEKYEKLRRYTVFPGDVIVTIMGTTGRSAVVPDDISTAITTKHLATITVDRDHAEPEFVSQALFRHPEVLHQIAAASRGAIMSGLNLGLIKALRIPIPPLTTQRKFARATNRIRKLAARMEAGGDADTLFSSLVARALSGKLNTTEMAC